MSPATAPRKPRLNLVTNAVRKATSYVLPPLNFHPSKLLSCSPATAPTTAEHPLDQLHPQAQNVTAAVKLDISPVRALRLLVPEEEEEDMAEEGVVYSRAVVRLGKCCASCR